jgi:uncharacterized protein
VNEAMARFVREFIDSRDPTGTALSQRHPFRRRFDHCLRCSVWARKIAIAERADAEIVEIAALFHDVAKTSSGQKGHGPKGAVIADEYLRSTGYESRRRDTICKIVSEHSLHATLPDASLEAKIVSDADFLDEAGAISVLWDAMACALEPEPSYDKAYERSLRFSAGLRETLPSHLHTAEAKRIAEKRFAIIDGFLDQLREELGRPELKGE